MLFFAVPFANLFDLMFLISLKSVTHNVSFLDLSLIHNPLSSKGSPSLAYMVPLGGATYQVFRRVCSITPEEFPSNFPLMESYLFKLTSIN